MPWDFIDDKSTLVMVPSGTKPLSNWVNVELGLWHNLASLDHNGLKLMVTQSRVFVESLGNISSHLSFTIKT